MYAQPVKTALLGMEGKIRVVTATVRITARSGVFVAMVKNIKKIHQSTASDVV